jgi:HdeA/HdeB family
VKRFLAAFLLVATLSTANAQNSEPRWVVGPLDVSCKGWLNAKGLPRENYMGWAGGYLSGINVASHGQPDSLREGRANIESIISSIDTYCQRNPQETFIKGLHIVWARLSALSGRKICPPEGEARC